MKVKIIKPSKTAYIAQLILLTFWKGWLRARNLLRFISSIAVCAMILAIIVGIIGGYLFDWGWTGLNGGYNIVTTSVNHGVTTAKGALLPKTLWDWLQLLIIPAVLALGGYWLNYTVSRGERNATEQRDQTTLAIALDQRREEALRDYIDKLSELLLHEHLRESEPYKEVRTLARVRTLTLLPRLDSLRKKSLIQFLYEANLIGKDKTIISLFGADLRKASFNESNFAHANFSEADLTGSRLSRSDFTAANFQKAILYGSDLYRANMMSANLREAHISSPIFYGADPNNTDLSHINLCNANLTKAELAGANLSHANLIKADLTETNLRGSIFKNADLTGAVLIGATLEGANFEEANLTGAQITQKQLDEVASLKSAIMPDGLKHL